MCPADDLSTWSILYVLYVCHRGQTVEQQSNSTIIGISSMSYNYAVSLTFLFDVFAFFMYRMELLAFAVVLFMCLVHEKSWLSVNPSTSVVDLIVKYATVSSANSITLHFNSIGRSFRYSVDISKVLKRNSVTLKKKQVSCLILDHQR